MAQPLVLEGTKEEVARQICAAKFSGTVRVTVEAVREPKLGSKPIQSRTMYDRLQPYIGSVNGCNPTDSSRVGEDFAEYLVENHEDLKP